MSEPEVPGAAIVSPGPEATAPGLAGAALPASAVSAPGTSPDAATSSAGALSCSGARGAGIAGVVAVSGRSGIMLCPRGSPRSFSAVGSKI
jgi:hypothetical protein